MNLATPTSTPAALPRSLSEAMRRAAEAEHELDRVFPLLTTKEGADDEVRAFAEQIRDAHREALLALRSWRVREASHEAAAESYERLARILESLAERAGLDASELD